MSKSLGNGILPQEVVEQNGADILRLWVASSDYHADIRISKEILNSFRMHTGKSAIPPGSLLGNLDGFDPDRDPVALEDLLPIDRWALHKLDEVNQKVRAGYDAFEFHQVYHTIHQFCVVDLSNFYLDVIKDRLYVERRDSLARRAAQTAMYRILDAMTRLIAPILAYTSDEIWQAMRHDASADARHVVFNEMPALTGIQADAAFTARWDRIHAVRDAVKKALELARQEKVIGASLEAKVQMFAQGELYDFLRSVEEEWATVLIVSQVELLLKGRDRSSAKIWRGFRCRFPMPKGRSAPVAGRTAIR